MHACDERNEAEGWTGDAGGESALVNERALRSKGDALGILSWAAYWVDQRESSGAVLGVKHRKYAGETGFVGPERLRQATSPAAAAHAASTST